jgi:predicted 3-demethylubiquinone-9 3-methyltransferase (glyoxalase superfamily)
MQKITPFLWFDGQAEEAANFYVSIFKNSKVTSVTRQGDKAFSVTFILDGQEFYALNAGPQFKFNEAVSFFVSCDTQKEIDEKWNKLIANGGQESMCGWLKDKFGLSWQIVPPLLNKLMNDKDQAKAGRVTQALFKMRKIDINALQKAYDS